MTVLLIDGDILVYRAALTSQQTLQWGDGIFTQSADMRQAAQKMDGDVRGWVARFKADAVLVALSDPDRNANWRRRVLPSYKNNRSLSGKPVIFKQCRAHLEDKYRTEQFAGLEGDDVLGLYGTGKEFAGDKRILISIDKDMANVPGVHWFNPNKSELGPVLVTPESALFSHMMQALTGDAVDGYRGLPGVGKVRASRILSDVQRGNASRTPAPPLAAEYWSAVVRSYETAGLTEEDALVQARVAHILVAGDYNKKTGVVKLWEPNKVESVEPTKPARRRTASVKSRRGRAGTAGKARVA